jgi:hypothetical protein
MKGATDFPALFKKMIKNQIKNNFLNESKEQHLNLKRTEIITYMIGFTP